MKINIKGIEIKFHFGMAMFDIFCGELGHNVDDLSKIGKQSKIEDMRLSKDLYYSCAKAYSELNETPFSFANEFGKEVKIKPLHFSDFLTDVKFNEEFSKMLEKAMDSSIPEIKQEKKQGEQIPLLVGQV